MNYTDYLVSHGYGTVIWTSLVFLLLLVLLSKFAWKPILFAIDSREKQITEALNAAKKAEADVMEIKKNNDNLLLAAKKERDLLLQQTQQICAEMMTTAKNKAQEEATLLLENNRKKIQEETKAAIQEIQKIVAELSIQVAEQILVEHLELSPEQEQLIQKNVENIYFN